MSCESLQFCHTLRLRGVASVAGLTGSLSSRFLSLGLALVACGSYTAATMRREFSDEPPSQEHGKSRSLYLKIKFPTQYLPSYGDVQIRQAHIIRLEDEQSVNQQALS